MHQFKTIMKAKVETGIVEHNKWCSRGHEMLRDVVTVAMYWKGLYPTPSVLFPAYLTSNALDKKIFY